MGPAPCDLAQEAEILALYRAAEERFGQVDILVNNAAYLPTGPMTEITEEEWNVPSAHSLGAHFPDVSEEDRGTGRRRTSDIRFLLLFNSGPDPISFTLPARALGDRWQLLLDTARSGAEERGNDFRSGEVYPLLGRSVALLRTAPKRSARTTGRR